MDKEKMTKEIVEKVTVNTLPPLPTPYQLARTLLEALHRQFPVFRTIQPLAIGIDKQLIAQLPDVNRKILRHALSLHTNSIRYLNGMEKAQIRFHLNGLPADEVTDAQRAHASACLAERFKKDAAQRKARRDAEVARQKADEAARQRDEKLKTLVEKFSSRGIR